jgi:predicted ribonuclease YlaK
MVLKQPKRDKRTDTYKGSISLINVLVLLLFPSKNNNYFINGHKVKINVVRHYETRLMKHIFIDTNIFLHFENFEKIDWLNEFNVETCKLIIPPIVIDELDKKKIGTSKISNKARVILNRFEELSEKENSLIKENVFFEILLNKPSKLIYEVNDLNFDEQDHRLIASIIDFRDKSGHLDIELCTNDIGPRLRAQQYGIRALKLNEKYLLPTQISEEAKRIKILENENLLLKTRIPSVKLKFENLKEFIKINVSPNNNLDFESFKCKRLMQ